MLTITIQDTNTERYTYTASANVLGRRYDNIAEYVSVVKPESEAGRDCIMIVTYGDTVVDHIPVGDTPIAITSNLSQYASVKIGFAFLGADGYIKNSEVKQFYFLTAQKPDGFVPLPPEQKTTIDYLISHGFTGAKLENNILSFTNAAGNTVVEIKLSGFIQEQADWNETDPIAETYIKNKPTKLSQFTNDSGFVTSETFTAHTCNKNNPHGVTAEQTGAYVKPFNGIPESDLSAEVQKKLNAGGAEKNLLQGEVNITVSNEAEDNVTGIDYALNAVVGKSYNVTVYFDNEEKSFLCKGVDFEGAIAIGSVGNDFSPYILLKENTGLLIVDKVDENGEIADNKSAIQLSHIQGSGDFSAVVKSITEVEEVVADKVKNPLKITVNGEQKTYDGSEAIAVDINTSGDSGEENLLKSEVTFAEVDGGIGFSILDYALNLEVGKAYKLKWDISGEQYSQTTYCWLKNDQIQLGTADSGGGGESILLIPNDPESGIMWVVDKYYANPATEETAPSENNASIVVTGYASTLKLISIEDAGVYIPVPTTADVGKILKVSAHGHYELVEP